MRFPEFKGEWKETTLGKCVIQPLDYGMNAAAIAYDGENKYIRITDINEESSQYISNNPVSPAGQLLDKYIVEENDILFARTGASTGKTYLYKKKDGKLYFAGFLIRAKIKTEYNSAFIFAQTKTTQYYKWVEFMSIRSGQPGINSQEYASYRFLIPQKEEQDKIASLLLLLDERITTQIKIIEKYESLIKGVSENIFSHKLDYVGLKQNWEIKYGNEIFESILDKNLPSNLPILAITQEYGAIPRDLIDYKVTVTDKSLESYKIVQVGDFIISLRSFQGGIEYSNYKGICSPAYIVLRPIIPINNIFYKYYLKTSNYIAKLNKNLEGIRDGKMISYKQFSEIPLPYPNITEQNKIAEILLAFNKKTEMEKLLLKRYSEQKKYLLNNLFI